MKKVLVILSTSILALLSGCTIDNNGNADWAPLLWILGIGIPTIIIALIISTKQQEKTLMHTKEKLAQEGLKIEDFKRTLSNYVGGHPDANDTIQKISYRVDNEDVIFCEHDYPAMPEKKFVINKHSIKNITVEDASSIENKITLGRVVLVGIFALAWRKKEKKELAFVVVEWNDGRFEHSTTFSFDGIGNAMTHANTMRNGLIRDVR